MAQQQLEKEPAPSRSSRSFTLAELVVIALDLALGALGAFVVYLILGSSVGFPKDTSVLVLLVGILLGCFGSLFAGVGFLSRARRIAGYLQLLGALGGLLILVAVGLHSLSSGQPDWRAFALYGSAAAVLMVLGFVGKRLAESEG